jgi:hypothetical protein
MLLIAKMSQDFVYDVLLLNTRDDSDRSPAAGSYAGLSLSPTTQGLTLPLAMLLRGAAISFELRLPKFGR